MRITLLVLFAILSTAVDGQDSSLIRTYDFVEIIDDQQEEAMYYYDKNWKVLREMAVSYGYVESFQLHEVVFSEDCPFHLILETVYSNTSQFEQREKNFEKLIEMKGEPQLLNEKEPSEFRKFVYGSDSTTYRRSQKE